MKRIFFTILLATVSSICSAEIFDFKALVDSQREKGDSFIFKCVYEDNTYDYIILYGEDEMRWGFYDSNRNPVKTAWAKPKITANSMTLHLDEDLDGSRERKFTLVSRQGNSVTWESPRRCAMPL